MEIKMTAEELEQFKKDGFISISSETGFGVYLEYSQKSVFMYGELMGEKDKDGDRHYKWIFNDEDLDRLQEKKPKPPCETNDPRCPTCFAEMIYRFAYCPKCGQKINWEDYKE